MKKRILGLLLVVVSTILVVACAKKQEEVKTTESVVDATETMSSQDDALIPVTVAASPTPHAEILYQIVDDMKEKGYELKVQEFSDYVLPNLAVDQDEIMANYFQHEPYLDDFNRERGTQIVPIGKVHYEPFGIYKGVKETLELESGDKVAVPNDVTNEARSLNLLEAAGIIKLKEGAGLTATKEDIVDNPYNVEIVELEAAQIPRSIDSVAIACMNGNYAMEAGFSVDDAIFIEPQESLAAKTYANIVCVKSGNETKEWALALAESLRSQKVKDFISSRFGKSVIAID